MNNEATHMTKDEVDFLITDRIVMFYNALIERGQRSGPAIRQPSDCSPREHRLQYEGQVDPSPVCGERPEN